MIVATQTSARAFSSVRERGAGILVQNRASAKLDARCHRGGERARGCRNQECGYEEGSRIAASCDPQPPAALRTGRISRDSPHIPPRTRVMSEPEGLSINTSSGAYRKALWAALAVFSILLLLALVTMYSADGNTTQNQQAAETVMCDRYATVDGSDDAEGTKAAPFNTVQRLIDSLSAGQVGCLRGGIYTEPDKQVVFSDGGKEDDRIILRSYPGETAEFRGSIYIRKGSDYVTVRNMRLDGSYGPVGKGHFKGDRNTKQTVRVMGNNVNIHDNDITNRRPDGDPDLAGTCIILGSSKITAANTSIKGNRIHRCGQMPSINREHGIYASHPRGAEISNNFIYNNADRGILLYPLVGGGVLRTLH
jgi:hypothetical protein